MPTSEWTVDFEFRANGDVERGAGSLQLWYVQDKTQVDSSSIYNVGQWDGFSLVFDVHGGKVNHSSHLFPETEHHSNLQFVIQSGSVRGFLNDGVIDSILYSPQR